MLNTNSIDTICHEHLEYYALHQVKEIADRSNFKIVDVRFNDCNGGSFRVYFAKRDSVAYSENIELIQKILSDEIAYGLMDNAVYERFLANCDAQVKYLCDFIVEDKPCRAFVCLTTLAVPRMHMEWKMRTPRRLFRRLAENGSGTCCEIRFITQP
jgi:hypothetical protein